MGKALWWKFLNRFKEPHCPHFAFGDDVSIHTNKEESCRPRPPHLWQKCQNTPPLPLKNRINRAPFRPPNQRKWKSCSLLERSVLLGLAKYRKLEKGIENCQTPVPWQRQPIKLPNCLHVMLKAISQQSWAPKSCRSTQPVREHHKTSR